MMRFMFIWNNQDKSTKHGGVPIVLSYNDKSDRWSFKAEAEVLSHNKKWVVGDAIGTELVKKARLAHAEGDGCLMPTPFVISGVT
jgi:hypothetical protein